MCWNGSAEMIWNISGITNVSLESVMKLMNYISFSSDSVSMSTMLKSAHSKQLISIP